MLCIEAAIGTYLKTHILPHEMDALSAFCLPASETCANDDIYIMLESVNGNWRVNEGSITPQSGVYDLSIGTHMQYTYSDYDEEIVIALYVREVSASAFIFDKFAIAADAEIIIGNTDAADIRINDTAKEVTASIILEGVSAVVESSSGGVYVNNRLIDQHNLQFFDCIYIDGIKLIFLGECLAVSCVNERVLVSLPAYEPKEADFSPVEQIDKLFFRSPRIFKKIVPEILEIEPPPTPKKQRFTPFMLQVGASVSMGAVMVVGLLLRAASGSGNIVTTVISGMTILGSLIGMVIFPKKMRAYQQKRIAMDEEARKKAYLEYLLEKDSILSAHQSEDAAILTERYPDLQVQAERIQFTLRELWERSPKNDDFLDIRFGIGRRETYHKPNTPEEGFTVEKDPLWAEVEKLKKKYRIITQVPISIELTKEIIVGIIGERSLCLNILKSVITQIVASHSYNDVKFIFLCDKQDDALNFARWLPHTWNDNRSFRFVAHNNSTLSEILDMITPNLNERKEYKENSSKDEVFIPHFVIVCTSEQLLKNEALQSRFLNSYDDIDGIGLSFIIVARTIDGLPLFCNTIIQCMDNQYGVYRAADSSNLVYLFKPDNINSLDLPMLSRRLFGTRTLDVNENRLLPDSLSFLGMYKVSSVEELSIEERWSTNSSEYNIRGYIGVSASNNFLLDIHEKAHGPHGLIAGTTGSGKSEFIQSFILSLAVNYHPHDVSFIIIDYKGGGTAQAFKNLPHLAGYITNLDGNQIRRSLFTLEVELSRRQKLFAQYEVNHIDKYQRMYKDGKAETPMPHLIIVADEFAELKQNRPDFMEKLVSTARIGRSLGVHLILATQKPTGVVNEQIVSNTRFRVCLKVASKEDSREMLKRNEAAEIVNVGRAYVQVGNDEIFTALQTGWSGAAYLEGDKRKALHRVAIHLLDETGRVCLTEESDKRTADKEAPTQLQAVVGALEAVAKQQGISPIRLWEEPLEDRIYLNDITEPRFDGNAWQPNPVFLSAAVGVLDDVPAQKRRILTADFGSEGHMALYGQARAGKNTFMQTMVFSLARSYAPDSVNIYIIDCEGRSTGYFKTLPHVGDVAFIDENQKIKKLFMMIDRIITERQILMEDTDSPDIRTYMQLEKKTLPSILVIIRNFGAFMETYWDRYDEKIHAYARDGAKYGVYLSLMTNAINDIKAKLQQNMALRLCMQMANPYDYINVLGKTDGLIPDGKSGRGLSKQKYVCEFQAALAVKPENVMEPEEEDIFRIKRLREEFAVMREAWHNAGRKAAPVIPVIPKLFRLSEALKSDEYREKLSSKSIPLGYDIAEIELSYLDLDNTRVYPVVGGPRTGKTNFIKSLMHLFAHVEGAALYVVDNLDRTLAQDAAKLENIKYAATEEEINMMAEKLLEIGKGRLAEYKANKNTYFPPIILLADDFSNLFKKLDDRNVRIINDLMTDGKKLGITQFISIGRREDFSGTDIIKSLFMYNQGILLGGNFDTYNYFTAAMEYKQREAILEPGEAYCFDSGKYTRVKTPLAD